jgi:hypothetical protein
MSDDVFLAKNQYVTGNSHDAAIKAKDVFAPVRGEFERSLGGPDARITVYRVGGVTPGKYQSYSLEPSRLGFFESKHGSKTKPYTVRVGDIAFPGSHSDLEVVIDSGMVGAR